MNRLIGLRVIHKKYGEGVIKSLDDYRVSVAFNNDNNNVRKFLFPDAFDTGFLKCKEETIANNSVIQQSKQETLHIDEINWLNSIGITKLFHFTDITNLYSILSTGYLNSRELMNMRNEIFFDGSNHDVIEHTENTVKRYVRFFYKEKTPTLYKSEGIKIKEERSLGHRAIPVALIFDRNIVFHDGVWFFDGSGSSKLTRHAKGIEEAKLFNWGTILKRGPHSEDKLYDPNNGEYSKRIIINHRNAEFLYPNRISIDYLKEIVFRTDIDMKRAVNECGWDNRYRVDEKYFDCNNNYLKDWKLTFTNKLEIDLMFNLENCFDFQLKLVLMFFSGETKEIILKREEAKYNGYFKWTLVPVHESIENIAKIEFWMDEYMSAVWENKYD